MFPCDPPFSNSRVGEIIDHGSFYFVPERFLQCTVTIVDEHAFTVSGISREKRTEPELIGSIESVERANSSEEKRCELAALLTGLDQVAPLRGQNIDPRPPALFVLLANLNSEINQGGNDSNGRHHLSDCGEHLPIHDNGVVGLTRTR